MHIQTLPLLDLGLASLSTCLAFAPAHFDGHCLNHLHDLLNTQSCLCQDYDDDDSSSTSVVEVEPILIGNFIATDENITASHSALFTPRVRCCYLKPCLGVSLTHNHHHLLFMICLHWLFHWIIPGNILL
jgi:hypothetical protein